MPQLTSIWPVTMAACAVSLAMSLVCFTPSHAQPVVRDHRGKEPLRPPPPKPATPPGFHFCFGGGLANSTTCTSGPKVRDHRKPRGDKR